MARAGRRDGALQGPGGDAGDVGSRRPGLVFGVLGDGDGMMDGMDGALVWDAAIVLGGDVHSFYGDGIKEGIPKILRFSLIYGHKTKGEIMTFDGDRWGG